MSLEKALHRADKALNARNAAQQELDSALGDLGRLLVDRVQPTEGEPEGSDEE